MSYFIALPVSLSIDSDINFIFLVFDIAIQVTITISLISLIESLITYSKKFSIVVGFSFSML